MLTRGRDKLGVVSMVKRIAEVVDINTKRNGNGNTQVSQDSAGDSYSRVAIHFLSGSKLLLPIAEGDGYGIMSQLDDGAEFLHFGSLDNRTIIVNKSLIADVFISSGWIIEFGPCEISDYPDYLGVLPFDHHWKAMEILSYSEVPERDIDLPTLREVSETFGVELEGSAPSAAARERFMERATTLFWGISSGVQRKELIMETMSAWTTITTLIFSVDCPPDFIQIELEEDCRFVVLHKKNLEYLYVPKHIFACAATE